MTDPRPDSDADRATRLARDSLIIDGHIDVPHWLHSIYHEDITRRTIGGDFDYPRAVEGGLDAAFMAIYVPVEFQSKAGAKAHADHLINMVDQIIDTSPDKFARATCASDIRVNHKKGLVSLPLGIENGVALEEDLESLAYFYDKGVRYITLTHAKDNSLCDSSYDGTGTHGGLSDFGKEVVREMNRTGMIVDVSHTSDEAFFDVIDVSEKPPVATHSSARHFTPGWERNMSDEMIRLLAEKSGLIMVNFGSDFLKAEYAGPTKKIRKKIEAAMKRKKLDRATEAGFKYLSRRRIENPVGTADDAAMHIAHIADLVGVDHIGLGSDFDGVFTFPDGLQDVSDYPNLLSCLIQRGFSDPEIKKICGENFLRVWDDIQKSAADR
ncbi:MAG: dipeptidase [Rhodothermia bacterium]|nr:dipeptidase [Rhodothermia bacterium]